MKPNLPDGWTEKELQEIAEHYDNQTEEEAIAEAEEAYARKGYSWVQIPTALMPEIYKLLASYNEQQAQPNKPSKRRAKP
jgi:hypothetical protein